jgi:L-lactate dehydrogenase (cytochrome)
MGMLNTFRSVVQFREFERDRVRRRLNRIADVGDYREAAKRRLPGGVFDYIDGGAEDERSLIHNVSAFANIEFKPRVLNDVSHVDTSTTLLGRRVPMPLALSPTGFTRIAHSQGELAVARAADRAGLPYSLSTMGTRSIEEVASVSSGSKWYQVYTWKDRGLVKEMINRAQVSGYDALLLTVDTAVLGRRERDVRRGYTLPPKIGLDTIIDGAIHPGWTLDFLRNDPITFANVSTADGGDGSSAVNLSQYINSQFDQALSWDDVEWLRSIWNGPVVLKGIQTVADAELAARSGVEGIMLSNHGGRQLDDAPAIVELVAPVAQAVGGRLDIICDGGVRRGSDIAKAVALGATACSIGRPYLYALGAGGEAGVDQLLEFFAEGFTRTMQLCGVSGVDQLTNDVVDWRR